MVLYIQIKRVISTGLLTLYTRKLVQFDNYYILYGTVSSFLKTDIWLSLAVWFQNVLRNRKNQLYKIIVTIFSNQKQNKQFEKSEMGKITFYNKFRFVYIILNFFRKFHNLRLNVPNWRIYLTHICENISVRLLKL